MNKFKWILTAISAVMLTSTMADTNSTSTDTVEKTYQTHCAVCHGKDRLGGTGSALLPENLGRLKPKQAFSVIKEGRIATQMQGFAKTLDDTSIQQLVDYIYTPLVAIPEWGEKQIVASHLNYPQENLSDTPVFSVKDPLNLFIVVELTDHSASLVDGDTFEVVHRFQTRPALHGGPKFSADGRYVYFGSRDGWIAKYDIYNLKLLYEVRAGINTRNIALSTDGKTVMVANYLPHNLVVLNADDLSYISEIPVQDNAGKSSRVSAVYTAPSRNSYIAALKDIPQIWEIPYAEAEKPTPTVHKLDSPRLIDDFFFSQDYRFLVGSSREGGKGVVINLDTAETVKEILLEGMPHLGSGISFDYNGKRVLATQNLRKNEITFIDMQTWEVIKKLQTPGPGFFMRSHENSPYALADVFFGEEKDKIIVIDKNTLEIVKTFVPEKDKTSAHIEFDRYGRHALVSLWEDEGALIIYDMQAFKEVKRLPMKKPSGKYNIYNKINFSEGTSH